ncbi:hypothetical protein CWR43_28260 [Rhizobium sullae]|uniref:Phosphohydrolase n=1 Tax=Rhizobium sullae TaxID=50338 RepID=A0A2N0D303_RHISU|nr:hypothetical protein [Rhizobium sullae]PKA40469.1 hypothetical protein CWR43_28260 [Rhizobium sullae]
MGSYTFSPKPYNDVADTTFGPIEKYIPANDNVPQDESGASAGFAVGGERGQYIGLRRGSGEHVVPPRPAWPERRGDFLQTYRGGKFWPIDPRSEEVFIEDIAHSLSLQCRYAGHCHRFYSVAEHSVLMARHLRWEGMDVALWALLHDASEAYLVDVPRPLKRHLPGYKEAEAKVMAAVCERFSLEKEMPAVVHDADTRIIGDELVNMAPMDWHDRYAGQELGVTLRYWSPAKAETEFLATFEALMECRARGMA